MKKLVCTRCGKEWNMQYSSCICGNQGADYQEAEAGVPRAGVLKAGVSGAGGNSPLRAVASVWLLEQIKKKVEYRNTILGNINRSSASMDAPVLLRQHQVDLDMLLWVVTCCGLVEIDEQAQRIAAVPSDMRDTFSRVLGRR